MAVGEGKVHILVIPFPDGQGHVNPILQFSKRLVLKGLKVTVLNTHEIINNANLNQVGGGWGGSINVENKPRVPYKGTHPEPFESYILRLQISTSFHLVKLITHHQTSNSPIACVVYDSLTPWVLDVARGFGLPGAPFFTESCAVNAVFYHIYSGSLKIPSDKKSVSLPALPLLQDTDLPSLISNPHQYPVFLRMMTEQFCNQPDWMFINTFHALEPQVLQWMQTHTPLKTVGPTVPSILLDKGLMDDNNYGMSLIKSTKEDSKIIEWLDSKDSESVIYVSFGSVSMLGEEQMKEIAWGLKASNKNFLWVIKEMETGEIPNKFVEEMKEMKGKVVKWCSQVQVLGHKSVGCFVTHCGWNSVLEGLSGGVPMVAMPQWTDQITNAKFVEDVWKVGVRVSPNQNGLVGREEIELCIRKVMEGEKRVEMRQNASKWMKLAKEAMTEDGSSNKNIDEFVAQIQERKI
ncbi:UDP-glycosyltransferase 74E2-like [Cucurbita pepo subsp. pepo]|uniref:UDP-glycosyltransferase 74E2-like n=1 Tax=Cucurbita pepo subsp. pepo TaxID=3664 RepID=UPI000C9D7962|nr:UDP-glycosyltransferase 74E2-like [Cucurbita pepo subsp. pepo]